MNIIIKEYQIFTGLPFWIGFGRFQNSLKDVLFWQMGLGFIRVNKYRAPKKGTK